MATTDDLARIDPILRNIAKLLFTYVADNLKVNVWENALLDVRFDEAGDFLNKIRVTRANGEVVSLSLPIAITHQLIELNGVRPSGKDRWHGLKLELTSEGECQIAFNYDPACANDPAFFAS